MGPKTQRFQCYSVSFALKVYNMKNARSMVCMYVGMIIGTCACMHENI